MLNKIFPATFILALTLLSSCGGEPVTRDTTSLGVLPTNPYTDPVAANPTVTLTAITGLRSDYGSNGVFTLSWNPVVGAASYEVYVSGANLGAVKQFVGTANAETYDVTLNSAVVGSFYDFSVRPIAGGAAGAYATISAEAGLLGTVNVTGTLPYALTGSTVKVFYKGNQLLGTGTSTAGTFNVAVKVYNPTNPADTGVVTIETVGGTGTGLAALSAPKLIAVAGEVTPATFATSINVAIDEASTALYAYTANKVGAPQNAGTAFFPSYQAARAAGDIAGAVADQLALSTLYLSYLMKNDATAWSSYLPNWLASSVYAKAAADMAAFSLVQVSALDAVMATAIPAFNPTATVTTAYVNALPITDVSLSFLGATRTRLAQLRGVGASIISPAATAPTTPTLMTPSVTVGDSSLSLAWLPVGGATGYNVYQNGVLTGAVTSSPYSFTGLTNGTAYSLGVTATNVIGESPMANATATPIAIPAAPTGLTESFDSVAQTITLNWNAVAGATSYNLSVGGTVIATQLTATTYTFGGATVGLTYLFDVTATNVSGTSANASISSVPVITPAAPTGLTATPQANGDLLLTWNPVAGATSYSVTVDYGAGVITSFVNSSTVAGLTKGVPHVVEVKSTVGGVVSSAATTTITIPNPAPLPAPLAINVTSLNSTTLHITWSAVAGAVSYNVTVNGVVSNVVGTFFDAGGLTAAQIIPISVSAVDALSNIGTSIATSAQPSPLITLAPANLVDTNVTVGSPDAQLQWVITDPTGLHVAFGGYIQVTLDANAPIPLLGTATTYTLTNLTAASHTIKVEQCNNIGCGTPISITAVYPH